VLIGTGRLASACLNAIQDHTTNVECIEPEEPPFSSFRSACARRRVQYRQIASREELGSHFAAIRVPTLVVSAYNSFMFPPKALANPHLNIVNFHNSLLPRHRGRNAPSWTIYEMDEVSGVTWHQVSAEVDKGEIVAQQSIALPNDISAIDLTQVTLALGAQVFTTVLPSVMDGTYRTYAASAKYLETFHRSTDLPNAGVLDLGWNLRRSFAFLRSMDYGKLPVLPAPKVEFAGNRYTIAPGYCISRVRPSPPKGIVLNAERTLITCSDGDETLLVPVLSGGPNGVSQ
jgi:methionyl-tRNA formyltransferase